MFILIFGFRFPFVSLSITKLLILFIKMKKREWEAREGKGERITIRWLTLVVVLPEVPKSSQLDVLPFKFRQIIYFLKIKTVLSISISLSIIYVKSYIFLVYQVNFIQKHISFFFCISFEELKPLDWQVLLVHKCFVFINNTTTFAQLERVLQVVMIDFYLRLFRITFVKDKFQFFQVDRFDSFYILSVFFQFILIWLPFFILVILQCRPTSHDFLQCRPTNHD